MEFSNTQIKFQGSPGFPGKLLTLQYSDVEKMIVLHLTAKNNLIGIQIY
jgi:hypothetical protein